MCSLSLSGETSTSKWSFWGPRQLLFWVLKPMAVLSEHFSTLQRMKLFPALCEAWELLLLLFPQYFFPLPSNFLHMLIGNQLVNRKLLQPSPLDSLPWWISSDLTSLNSQPSPHLKVITVLFGFLLPELPPGDATVDFLYLPYSRASFSLHCIAVQCL